MVTAADGTVFTAAVTVYYTIDNGTQTIGSVGSGVCTHEGNGYHSYAPTQAETNGDHIAWTFIGTGAVAATLQLYTTFPQTVDNDTKLTTIAADVVNVDGYNLATQIGTAGAGLTNIGTIATVTTLTNLPAITTDWLTAAGTAADFTTEIQSGLATPTNITAGTITTVTTLTNAPTNGDLTAAMKLSVNAEADTALSDINLDHLMKVAVANNADLTTEVVDATVLSHIMSAGDTSVFAPTTDGLQLIRDAVSAIGIVGTQVAYAPSTVVRTIGDNDGGAEGDTTAHDDVYMDTGENASTGLSVLATVTTSTVTQIPTMLHVTGYYSGGPGHQINVQIYNWVTNAFETVGVMLSRSTAFDYTFPMSVDGQETAANGGTDTGQMQARFVHNAATYNATHLLRLDYISFDKQVTDSETATAIAAIKAQTDQLQFTLGNVHSDTKAIEATDATDAITTAATAATPTVTLTNGAHGGAAASIVLADYSAFKATGFATPTNITAGTITTVTNLTNLPAGVQTSITNIEADTNELQLDWQDGGRLDLLLDGASAPTAATVATAVWTDTTASDFTTALSVGKSVMNGVALGTGLTIGAVTGAVGNVTGAVGSVAGNVDGNVTGSVGSVSTAGMALFSSTDTGETTPVAGSVAKLAQGAGGGSDVTSINGTSIAGTGSQVADAFTFFFNIAGASTTIDDVLDAAATRAALGLASANLDTQLGDIPTVAEFNARTRLDADYFSWTTDAVANVTLVATTTTNTDMRGTDSAALASVCTEGRLAELDAGNLPTDVAAIPTTAMRGTDSAALASVCTEGRLAELDAGNLPTDVAAIPTTAMRGTDSAALATALTTAQNDLDLLTGADGATLATVQTYLPAGIVSSTSKAGTLTTTAMSTNLTEATDDHYIGRTVVWTTGVLLGQASDITDYVGVNGVLTFSALTEAPGAGDGFIIV